MKKRFASCMLFLSACVFAQPEQPAVIDPTEQSHTELTAAVTATLGVGSVTLAQDALTQDSTLFIERMPVRDAAGRRLNGRDYAQPEQFHLFKRDDECVLVHSRTGQRRVLAHTQCRVLAEPGP